MTERILMPTIKSNAQTNKLCQVFVIRPSVDGSVEVFNDAFHVCGLECYFHYALERRGVNGEGQEGSIKTRD